MTSRIVVILGMAALAISIAVAFPPRPDEKFWPPIVIGIAVFSFGAFAFNPVRWAVIAVAGFALGLLGLNFRFHPTELAGIAALAATIVGGSIYTWFKARERNVTDVRD